MAEANRSIHQAQIRAMGAAIITLARRGAIRETKAALQRQGRKPMHMPHREIIAAADDYLAHTATISSPKRSRLLNAGRPKASSAARNLRHSISARRPDPQGL
jgi:hypothetical protein